MTCNHKWGRSQTCLVNHMGNPCHCYDGVPLVCLYCGEPQPPSSSCEDWEKGLMESIVADMFNACTKTGRGVNDTQMVMIRKFREVFPQALQAQRKELAEKIEGLRKSYIEEENEVDKRINNRTHGYNACLEDIKQLLK